MLSSFISFFKPKPAAVVDGEKSFDIKTAPTTYSNIISGITSASDTNAIRTTLDGLVNTDIKMLTLSQDSLRTVANNVAEILKKRDESILLLSKQISKLEEAIRNPVNKEAKKLDQNTLAQLGIAHQALLLEKARAIFYLRVVLEVYRLIISSRSERHNKVSEVKRHIDALDAAQHRSEEARKLIRESISSAHIDRLGLEATIAKISPELLLLVETTAGLHSDLIISASHFIDSSVGKSARSILESDLLEMADTNTIPDLVRARIGNVIEVVNLTTLLASENKLDPNGINKLQNAINSEVKTVLDADTATIPIITNTDENELKIVELPKSEPSPKFKEILDIYKSQGISPQAANETLLVMTADTSIKPEELSWIESKFGTFRILHPLMIEHPSLTGKVLTNIIQHYKGNIDKMIIDGALNAKICSPSILELILTSINADHLSSEQIHVILNHKVTDINVRSSIKDKKILALLVLNNKFDELVEYMHFEGLDEAFREEVFKNIFELYNLSLPNHIKSENGSVCANKGQEGYKNFYSEKPTHLNTFNQNHIAITRFVSTYYKYLSARKTKPEIALINLSCKWLENFPKLKSLDNKSEKFGFYYYTENMNNWTPLSDFKQKLFDFNEAIKLILEDKSMPDDVLIKMVDNLPKDVYVEILPYALSHQNAADTWLRSHYTKTDLSMNHAHALAKNPNLSESGLTFIVPKCNEEHQMIIANHKNFGSSVRSSLIRNAKSEEVRSLVSSRI